MQNGCEVEALTEFQRSDSVTRHMFYNICGGFHFSFELSEIKYKLGSYSEALRKTEANRDARQGSRHAILGLAS